MYYHSCFEILLGLDYSRVEIAAAARPQKKGGCPLFYILIIMALKKMKYEKRGLSPFFYARRVKNADIL